MGLSTLMPATPCTVGAASRSWAAPAPVELRLLIGCQDCSLQPVLDLPPHWDPGPAAEPLAPPEAVGGWGGQARSKSELCPLLYFGALAPFAPTVKLPLVKKKKKKTPPFLSAEAGSSFLHLPMPTLSSSPSFCLALLLTQQLCFLVQGRNWWGRKARGGGDRRWHRLKASSCDNLTLNWSRMKPFFPPKLQVFEMLTGVFRVGD